MIGTLGLIGMMGTYEDRCVSRWMSEDETTLVSTARVYDGSQPYETAICHPSYHDEEYIIVEAYDTEEQACEGHDKWEKIIKNGPLPDVLVDCQNAEISKMIDKKELVYKRKHT
jgi:hypothetical protein